MFRHDNITAHGVIVVNIPGGAQEEMHFIAREDSFSVFGADGEEQDGSGTFQRREVGRMFSRGKYYNVNFLCYNISPFFGHAKTEGRSGRKRLRGRAHPGRRVYSHAVGCNVIPAAVSCGAATHNATPLRFGGGPRWVTTPRASRLFACSGVQRFTGGGQLQNCHAQCNAPAVGGGPSLGRNYKDVPLCHLRAYPYCICRQKVARNMERMTKLARAHAVPHFCGRYELEFNILRDIQRLGAGIRQIRGDKAVHPIGLSRWIRV